MGGLRVALEQIKALTEIPFAHTAGDHELIYQIATEALAQQPAAGVELTDAELLQIHTAAIRKTKDWHVLAGLRAVIAAHIAKQGGV